MNIGIVVMIIMGIAAFAMLFAAVQWRSGYIDDLNKIKMYLIENDKYDELDLFLKIFNKILDPRPELLQEVKQRMKRDQDALIKELTCFTLFND